MPTGTQFSCKQNQYTERLQKALVAYKTNALIYKQSNV